MNKIRRTYRIVYEICGDRAEDFIAKLSDQSLIKLHNRLMQHKEYGNIDYYCSKNHTIMRYTMYHELHKKNSSVAIHDPLKTLTIELDYRLSNENIKSKPSHAFKIGEKFLEDNPKSVFRELKKEISKIYYNNDYTKIIEKLKKRGIYEGGDENE